MKKHFFEFTQDWDLDEENTKMFIRSVIITHGIDVPVTVEVSINSRVDTFVINE
ncbi:hypothetical protein [Paenibacillus terrae]|uniref:hypothetical protein n=1 Tax=Paenibacillus terrae TaxID=159743 RepID=UPI000AB5CA02|nr:hypothetical protein [Paenibacillus terrae]